MTGTEPRLFVMAASPLQAFNWANSRGIPRSKMTPLTERGHAHRLRGERNVVLFRHDTWVHTDLNLGHEVHHILASIKAAGGTVVETYDEADVESFRDAPKPPPMSEDDFKARVIDFAKLCGWKVVHYRPARTAKGFRTALEGDKGCPDLILARDGWVLLVELKSETGRVTREQREWLAALGDNGRLWRPSNWPLVERTLR